MNGMTGHGRQRVYHLGLVAIAVSTLLMSGCTSRESQGDGKLTFIKGREYTTGSWGRATGFTGIDDATLAAITNADRVMVSGFVARSTAIGSSPIRDDWELAYDHASLIARYLIERGVRQERLMISSGGNVHPTMIDRAIVENRVEVVWHGPR